MSGRQIRLFHASATSVHTRMHFDHDEDTFLGAMPEFEAYALELREGIYRGNLKSGETPTYHRRIT